MKQICLLELFLLFFFKNIWSCKSLKSVNLNVPIAVRAGHSVTLECDYDLEGAPLYSVKWYYGDSEFYRYVPKEEPPTRVFPLRGMHVDVSVSNSRNVTLLTIDRQLSGTYKCEVSADAPSFHTEIRTAKMVVAVVPDGVPVVTVDKSRLEQGGPLIAECTAPPAYPAPNLTWFVNDQKVPGSTSTSIRIDKELLETATGKLELTGAGGTWVLVRLKCEASVFRLYRASSIEVSIKPESLKPQPASILLMESISNGCYSTTNRQDHLHLCILLCLTVMILLRQQMIVS